MSEPKEGSNTIDGSEPHTRSNPTSESEPTYLSKPRSGSEPWAMSSPIKPSEPRSLRNPRCRSEPSEKRASYQPILRSKPMSKKVTTKVKAPAKKRKAKPGNNGKPAEAPKIPQTDRVFTAEQLESLRKLVRCYYDYQEEELRLRGIMGVKKDDTEKKGRRAFDESLTGPISERLTQVVDFVEELEAAIKKEVRKHPLWNGFLKQVTGCGEGMAAVIITEIDINRAITVSKIWQFAGCNPGMIFGKQWKVKKGVRELVTTTTQVRGDEYTKGFIRPYNEFLATKLKGVLASSFHRSKSPYLIYYNNYHQRLVNKNWGSDSKNPMDKDRPKAGHQHLASNRYMVKMFIADLYNAWRTIEGLPVRVPYHEEYLGHTHGGE